MIYFSNFNRFTLIVPTMLVAEEMSNIIYMCIYLTCTSPHSPRFRIYAYPTRQPVTNTVPGWIVCHPCFTLCLSTLLFVSCYSCLLSCSPLWPHLSQMSGTAYPVNLCVFVCGVYASIPRIHSVAPTDDHLKTHPYQKVHVHMHTHTQRT